MQASQWLILTAAVSFSYAAPLDKMHPQRPLKSLFHPAIIISILGTRSYISVPPALLTMRC